MSVLVFSRERILAVSFVTHRADPRKADGPIPHNHLIPRRPKCIDKIAWSHLLQTRVTLKILSTVRIAISSIPAGCEENNQVGTRGEGSVLLASETNTDPKLMGLCERRHFIDYMMTVNLSCQSSEGITYYNQSNASVILSNTHSEALYMKERQQMTGLAGR
ncbi:hypothetical protein EVAR_53387_1 [Eumeta japonica]|uniref:Uncharacterized protein n=1 Tax=Eumeta variegata TaxID=151549 RepID=A0A4C1Y9A4_EUMVA|nr:hypothetical protein EVAR_53387_1 [Eumeta japonica]